MDNNFDWERHNYLRSLTKELAMAAFQSGDITPAEYLNLQVPQKDAKTMDKALCAYRPKGTTVIDAIANRREKDRVDNNSTRNKINTMKPETKRLLLDVELELAKEALIFKVRSLTPIGGKRIDEEELQPFIERYEKALDAVKESMEMYRTNIQGVTGVIDTAMPMSDSEFIQSEYWKLAKIQIKNK